MRVVNQGFRATNVIAAAVKCGRRFTLSDDFYPNYRRFGKERGSLNDSRVVEGTQQSWMSSSRNALQRLSGNSAEFRNRGGTLSLFESLGKGRFVIRDEYYQTLIDGMNKHLDSLMREPYSGLQIALDGDVSAVVTSHLIGCYAQQKVREYGERVLGWRNVQDFSMNRAYDLTFVRPGRTGGVCYVECKGTTKRAKEAVFELTSNEVLVAAAHRGHHLVATVTDIRVKDGEPTGGKGPLFVDPFADDEKIQHLKLTFRLRV